MLSTLVSQNVSLNSPACAEIAAVAVAMFALAWLNKKNQNQLKNQNQKMNNLAFCESAVWYFSEAKCS